MELSPEDRDRIYQEEKARRETDEKPATKAKAKMRAGRKASLIFASLAFIGLFLLLLIHVGRSSFTTLTPAQHLEKAQLAMKSGASLSEISEGLVHLSEIPASAPEAEQARTLGLEPKLRQAQGIAARREAQEAPAPASHNGIGDVVTVHEDGWVACGSTKAALDEIINWQVRHDADETKQTMMATRSLPLFPGTQVKILDDEGFIIRKQKVRILVDTLNGATVGSVCWVDSEMLK